MYRTTKTNVFDSTYEKGPLMRWNLCMSNVKQIFAVFVACGKVDIYSLGEKMCCPISLAYQLMKQNNLIFHLVNIFQPSHS